MDQKNKIHPYSHNNNNNKNHNLHKKQLEFKMKREKIQIKVVAKYNDIKKKLNHKNINLIFLYSFIRKEYYH